MRAYSGGIRYEKETEALRAFLGSFQEMVKELLNLALNVKLPCGSSLWFPFKSYSDSWPTLASALYMYGARPSGQIT